MPQDHAEGGWGGGFFGGGRALNLGATFSGALKATTALQSLQSAAAPWLKCESQVSRRVAVKFEATHLEVVLTGSFWSCYGICYDKWSSLLDISIALGTQNTCRFRT